MSVTCKCWQTSTTTRVVGNDVSAVCKPTEFKGRRVRALQPLSPEDGLLLDSLVRSEFAVNGFRIRDLHPLLFGDAEVSPIEAKFPKHLVKPWLNKGIKPLLQARSR
jgi:hypothetical protein